MASKIIVYPANEDQHKKVIAYLGKNEVLFNSSLNGKTNGVSKSEEEIIAETAFRKLSGKGRFRMTEEEKQAVESGELTRAQVINNRIKAMGGTVAGKAPRRGRKAKAQSED